MKTMNTAILWDIENVTPPKGTNYVQMVVDTLSQNDKISYAMAFGDWNKSCIKDVASDLAANSFELIHVPASRKNSSDMSMVAYGVELIFQYPHIEKYVLITGDADFRPLLLSLRKYGKVSLVICDVKRNASDDLLRMADDYLDYRDIIEEDDAGDDRQDYNQVMSKGQAYELLEDSLLQLEDEKRKTNLSSVKIRMKLLDSSFNEKRLGFSSFKSFVRDAMGHTSVLFSENGDDVLELKPKADVRIPEVFQKLVAILAKRGPDWVSFIDAVKDFEDYKTYGYGHFKRLALDAEKRGLVEVRSSGNRWFLRLLRSR